MNSGGKWLKLLSPRALFAFAFLAVVALFAPQAALKAVRGSARSLAEKFPHKKWFVELNGGILRAAGRRCCNNRMRYRNGMIGNMYGIADYSITNGCPEVSVELSFAKRLGERGIPFLFVLAPCKMSFDGELMPRGWCFDNPNVGSRAVAQILAGEGVEVLDLVPRYASTKEDISRHFFATDHHWNIRTALEATSAICDRLSAILREPALRGNSRLDVSSWRRRVLKSGFVGAHGRRTGRAFSGTEDFEYFLPLFETQHESFLPGGGERRKGSFVEAEFNRKYLRPEQREWRWLAYGGPAHGLKVHRNLAPVVGLRCMVVKDSFGRHPVSFLSTVFGEVIEVDPRLMEEGQTVDWAVDSYKPDVVAMIVNPSSVLGVRWLKAMENPVEGKDVKDAVHVH